MSDSLSSGNITRQDLYDQSESMRSEFSQQVDSIHAESLAQSLQAQSEHRLDMLLERIGSNEARTKAAINEKFNWYLVLIILTFLTLLLLGGLNFIQLSNPKAGESVFVLSNPNITGPTELCPGDKLKFDFTVDVKAIGVYSLYMSTWKVDPPPSVVIFSELQPFVIGSTRSFPIEREWKIPRTYEDPADSLIKPMIEGRYIRDIAVAAVGKNTNASTLQVPFTIRKDCPE